MILQEWLDGCVLFLGLFNLGGGGGAQSWLWNELFSYKYAHDLQFPLGICRAEASSAKELPRLSLAETGIGLTLLSQASAGVAVVKPSFLSAGMNTSESATQSSCVE